MDPRSHIPDITCGSRMAGAGLHHILAFHCAESGAAYAALLEESGFLYADAGDDSLRDHGETAALAVGAWHAAREVARRLGESDFHGISQEGSERHFYISPVDERFLLLTVFGNDTKTALIRATATRSAPALREALNAGAGP
jgi:predicted regulator of Ras-like GTPase activity (Roadblock/LC7/MglB family)